MKRFLLPSAPFGFCQTARALVALLLVCAVGCGTTKQRLATEQLLVSDAVDLAVSSIDFSDLEGRAVFFDTQFINTVKGLGFVNSDYIISSLRQQMVAADCRLTDDRETAEVIVEARVGTLGTDGNEVVYGIPASNGLSSAAALVPNAPVIPAIPEISFARKDSQSSAAKIAVFAYDRETREPIWQSGISRASSNAQDFYVFGAGPFQHGSIYDGTRFAGEKLSLSQLTGRRRRRQQAVITYSQEHHFGDPADDHTVQLASFDQAADAPEADSPDADAPEADSPDGDANDSDAPAADAPVPQEPQERPLVEAWPLKPRIVSPLESQLDWSNSQ